MACASGDLPEIFGVGHAARLPDRRRRVWPALAASAAQKAVKNFVAVVGSKEIANITRDDMLDFRQHWLDRFMRPLPQVYEGARMQMTSGRDNDQWGRLECHALLGFV